MKRILCVLLAMMFVFTACGKSTEAETPVTDNQISEESEIQLPTEEDLYKAEYEIETPYLTLKRADIWGEDIQIEQTSSGGSDKWIFTTEAAGEKIELFTVEFTQQESEGFLIGVISAENDVNVYIDVKTIEKADEWSDEEFGKLNLMQEYVNDIIGQLYELENFEPSNN